MCTSCWEEYGAPRINNHGVRNAAKLLKELSQTLVIPLTEKHPLHMQLIEWELEDFDQTLITKTALSQKQAADVCEVMSCMKSLCLAERASALALHYGYWTPIDGHKNGLDSRLFSEIKDAIRYEDA